MKRPPRKTLHYVRLETWGDGIGLQCMETAVGPSVVVVLTLDAAADLGKQLAVESARMAAALALDARVRAAALRRQRDRKAK